MLSLFLCVVSFCPRGFHLCSAGFSLSLSLCFFFFLPVSLAVYFSSSLSLSLFVFFFFPVSLATFLPFLFYFFFFSFASLFPSFFPVCPSAFYSLYGVMNRSDGSVVLGNWLSVYWGSLFIHLGPLQIGFVCLFLIVFVLSSAVSAPHTPNTEAVAILRL